MKIVYFSGRTNNTHHFVQSLNLPEDQTVRITEDLSSVQVDDPFILIVPTYSDCTGKGAVPDAVERFLDTLPEPSLLKGVVSSGHRNFGSTYAMSGRVISVQYDVPWLTTFELRGAPSDARRVLKLIEELNT